MRKVIAWITCALVCVVMLVALPVAADGATTYALAEYANCVKLLGRTVVTDDGIVPYTTGAGIAFYSDCSGDITLKVTGSCDKFDEQYFAVYVDGELTDRVAMTNVVGEVTQTLTVATGLESGKHRIEICRDTEEVYAYCVFEEIALNGELEPVEESDLLIEFIGDSLTCGYASNPKPQDQPSMSVEHPYCEIGTQAYAYLTAQALEADFQSCCASGYGVVTGWNSDGVTLSDMYEYASYYHGKTAWSFERPADVVVINLGSNDNVRMTANGYTEADVVDGMKALMEQVREKNPEASIVWATGMAGVFFEDGLKQVIDELGGAEAGFYYCELPYGTSGGAGHPNPEEHEAAAQALVTFLTENEVLPSSGLQGDTLTMILTIGGSALVLAAVAVWAVLYLKKPANASKEDERS